MKWHNLRHALYLKSSDFLAMLSLIHILKLMLVGFGVIRNAHDIHDIQDQSWAMITSTIVFTICLAGSRRGYSAVTSTDSSSESDGTSEGGEKTYSRFHRFFLPIVLLISLIDLITMSAYHGIITVLALHLVLISFTLTGFPCIILLGVNIIGVVLGTGFHLVLVRRLYSGLEGILGHHSAIGGPTSFHGLVHNTSGHWSHAQNRLTELATSFGYGLATKASIVLLDMGLLLVHIVGGMVFYSRFWKMGLLMGKFRNNPSYYVSDFPLVVKLEQAIFNAFSFAGSGARVGTSGAYDDDQVSGGLGKKIVGSSVHGRAPAEGEGEISCTNSQDSSPKKNENFVDDEREDVEWLKFLEQNDSVKTFGRRTYSTEPIQLNYLPPNTLGNGYPDDSPIDRFGTDFYDDDFGIMGTMTSLYGSKYGTLTTSNLGSRIGSRFGSRLTSNTKITSKVDSVSTNVPLSTTTTFSDETITGSIAERLLREGGEGLGVNTYSDNDNLTKSPVLTKNSAMVRFNTKPFTTIPVDFIRDRIDVNSVEGDTEKEKEVIDRKIKIESSSVHHRALNSSLKEDKLMNISVELQGPFTKLTYLLMPNWAKKIMRRAVVSSNSMKKKREVVRSLRWSGPRSLPHFNALQLFSYEQYEWLYVKWMHSFNRMFYNSTFFEMIVIIFYSSTGTILLGYRHYLTLSDSDKEIYIGKTSRLITLALRFILYPIISLILIISVGYILLNPGAVRGSRGKSGPADKGGKNLTAVSIGSNIDQQSSLKGDLTSLKASKKGKNHRRERILGVYWLMLLLCLIDFVGSLFDVLISLGLETPPYAVHNSLVMQFLMTKTAAFLLLRFPTLFVLYLVYFIGLFTAQFFLKHSGSMRFVTMQVSCQLVIGVGSWCFLIRPIDVNRRRVFSEVILPYVLYLSNFVK